MFGENNIFVLCIYIILIPFWKVIIHIPLYIPQKSSGLLKPDAVTHY